MWSYLLRIGERRVRSLWPVNTSDTSVLATRRSSKDCFISYAGNLYSVPAAYARKTLQVKITEAEELVMCSEVGDVLARHRVLFGRQERSVQVDHYRGLGTPVSRVEQASAVQELRPAERTMFCPRIAQRDRLVVKHFTSGTKTVRKSVNFCIGILA